MTFWEVTKFLLDGFYISLLIFGVTLLCGAPLGLPIAFCSMSKFAPLKWLTRMFVGVIRGTPLMIQLLIFYYVLLPLMGIHIPSLNVATLVFGLNSFVGAFTGSSLMLSTLFSIRDISKLSIPIVSL